MRTTVSKIATVIIGVTIAFIPTSAQAAEYEYWSYFHGADGAWSMSMEGATYIPADGTIEGWRYVKTAGDALPENPRVAPDFNSICANTQPEEGKKRVGLVVDFGTVASDDERPPVTECALVDEGADGFAVLSAVRIVTDNGMVSCIEGVPSSTCEAVPALMTTTAVDESEDSSSLPIGPLLLFVALVGAGAFFFMRGKRK